jgi:hypothetical protein
MKKFQSPRIRGVQITKNREFEREIKGLIMAHAIINKPDSNAIETN